MGFKKNFIWGAATASFQIEGAADKRGDSIWDVFCRQEGNVFQGHDGTVACDHVNRFREDVALMKELGIRNYRFSISWPRVLPEGVGQVNEEGLQFYSNLVDCLLANGIQPYVTLYHWDLPQALMAKGGFMNPDFPLWFENYTEVVAKKLGDRVKHFFTFNEPQCCVGLGYFVGVHAPGIKNLPLDTMVPLVHRFLKAHGLAVQKLRQVVPGVKISIVPCGAAAVPATADPADRKAAYDHYFSCGKNNYFSVSLYMDPVVLGKYPDEYLAYAEKYLPTGWQEDMALISQPIDFVSVNLYYGDRIRQGADGKPEVLPHAVGEPRTDIGWGIEPEALYWASTMLYQRYQLPIVIAENGMSCHDVVSLDGKVHDPNRIDYLNRYLLGLRRAAEEGVDVMGYFQWSLMDNFEWGHGYSQRFGLIHVDYQTQKRTPKDSAYWYGQIIATNGESL
ncbi:MAG: beta-glucosidase [Clostridia bacterium]|nr:beta-glucosidase [Clostridia bacterium]